MNAAEARTEAKKLSANGKTYAEIAKTLMARGYRGPQGGTKLGPSTVSKLINYGIKARGRGAAGSKASLKARRAQPVVAASTLAPPPPPTGSRTVKVIRSILDLDIGDVVKLNMIAAMFEG
jgi:hypothetical protein